MTTGEQLHDTETFRYEAVASFLVDLVEAGTLASGSKAPSLREISRSQGVSVTTALAAYRLLESRGILEARPQSGFYVRHINDRIERPSMTRPPRTAQSVHVSGAVNHLLEFAADPGLVPLGCAIPSPGLLASSRLDRFLSRVAREHGNEYNTYSKPKGDESLRQSIAKRAIRFGETLSPEDIIITCGCTEALYVALRSVACRGDTVAIESPTYFGLLQVLEALELKVLELPTDSVSGLDLMALERALASGKIKTCLLSSSFNNPLGCLMSDHKKGEVLEILARHDVTLIEDDIYGDIYFGSERPRPFSALEESANTIYCSSFSKTLAPGYRIGWVASRKWNKALLNTKFPLTLCSPTLTQAAMAAYLTSGAYDNHLRRMRRELSKNVKQVIRTISNAFPDGTRVSQPAGGFVLWVELPEQVNTRNVFEKVLKEGICFAPGDLFTASDRYANCLRISCGHSFDSRIERGLWKLAELIAKEI